MSRSAVMVYRRSLPVLLVILALGLVFTTVRATVEERTAPVAGLPGFADIVESVAPAVVNISVSGQAQARFHGPHFSFPEGSPFEEFFKRHFGQPGGAGKPQYPARKVQAQGSGFIVDASGLVVTNYHVVRNAEEIRVITHDGEQHAAVIKGADEATDLALLEIEGAETEFPYLTFGDSDSARVGDWVVAIGNPFGLGGSATTGIVSARGRNIQSGPLDDYLQIDAPINRGNSGGPLFNTQGEVVGVNTAIFSPNGGNVGIGFAIPSNMADRVVRELAENGVVERGWLGVYIQAMDNDIAASLGLDSSDGALITSVVEDSPAERADLRPGDVILSYNGDAVETVRDLPRLVARTKPDSEVGVEIWREETPVSLDVVIDRKENTERVAAAQDRSEERRLGLALSELTPEIRGNYGIGDEVTGILVAEVEPGSPAFENGIRPGDVIKRVGQIDVSTVEGAVEAVERIKEAGRGSVLLLIQRKGRDRFVAIKLA